MGLTSLRERSPFCSSALQLIRDLKEEVRKLRDLIRAEGLEALLKSHGKFFIVWDLLWNRVNGFCCWYDHGIMNRPFVMWWLAPTICCGIALRGKLGQIHTESKSHLPCKMPGRHFTNKGWFVQLLKWALPVVLPVGECRSNRSFYIII